MCDYDQGSEEEQQQQQQFESDLRKRATKAVMVLMEEALMLDEVEWRKSEVRVY